MKDRLEVNEVWKRDELQSPCIKLCMIHPEARICVGCHRTLEEIASWSRMTEAERIAVMMQLPSRKPQLQKRRGGRSAHLDRQSREEN